MNGKRSASAALLPMVAFVSTLAQNGLQTSTNNQRPREQEKAATVPDLRIEPIAIRIARGKLYGLVPLADGRILAFDRGDRQPVYLMTKARATSGTYTLSFNGSLTVIDGVVTKLTGIAQSSAHTLTFDRPGHLVVKWRVRVPASADRAAPGPLALSVIDLKDGRLMLIEGNRIYHLKLRLAPDGEYRSPAIGSLSVRRGALDPVAGEPDFMLADDFAP